MRRRTLRNGTQDPVPAHETALYRGAALEIQRLTAENHKYREALEAIAEGWAPIWRAREALQYEETER